MADEMIYLWEREDIPDNDSLWMRVHRMWFTRDGSVSLGAFSNKPTDQDGMSVDWDKYARPEDTRSRARNPKDNAVIHLIAGEVRQIPDQAVIHTPDAGNNNRAHTDVLGEKHPEARVKLSRIYKLVIPLDQQVS